MFENDRKRNEKDPDWKGSALIGGHEYWVSCWDKVTGTGKNLRSLSFSRKDATAQRRPAQGQPQQRPAQQQQRYAPRPMPPKQGQQPPAGEDEVPF